MDFNAAIFDMDGTLVDSYMAWENGYRKLFTSMNHAMTNDEFDKLYRMTSDESNEFVRKIYLSQERDNRMPFESVMENFNADMESRYVFDVQEKPYALEYIKMLYNRKIPVCVATLSPISLAKKVLTKLGFMPYLNFILTGDDVGLSKRFPDIYFTAAERLGSLPSETIVFEDCPVAAMTAHNAGFVVCGVVDRHQNQNMVQPYCHWSIADYLDVYQAAS